MSMSKHMLVVVSILTAEEQRTKGKICMINRISNRDLTISNNFIVTELK